MISFEQPQPPPQKVLLHAGGVALLALLAGAATLQEPSLGDDLTYWRLALGFHTDLGDPWGPGFHALRWPLWGMIWLLQFVVGTGLASYCATPLVYLALGAAGVFAVTFILFRSISVAWLAGILLIFNPLLDPSITRPMPDLPEGVWMTVAFLTWLKAMTAGKRGEAFAWSALNGLAISIGYANRITGLFIVPALVLATVLCFPRRFGWLLMAGLFTLCFTGVEALVYHQITGDFLHSVNANLGARGRKGTETMELWMLPLRFVDTLWHGNPLKIIINLLALAGAWFLWKKSPAGRAVVVWAVTVFLAYSCGIQSLSEPRPLVREGDRFLTALAMPLSVLAGAGIGWLIETADVAAKRPWHQAWRFVASVTSPPAAALFVIAVGSTSLMQRPLFNLGWVPPVSEFINRTPAGSRILADQDFRDLCFLANARGSARMDWIATGNILEARPDLEADIKRADGIWFSRKQVWVSTRKRLEREEISTQKPLPDFLTDSGAGWRAVLVVPKDDAPDLIFLTRRTPGIAAPPVADYTSLASQGLLPALELPARLEIRKSSKTRLDSVRVPEEWRGKNLRIETRMAANTVEAFSVQVRIEDASGELAVFNLKPYLFPEPAADFFMVPVPLRAQEMEIRLSPATKSGWVELQSLRVMVE